MVHKILNRSRDTGSKSFPDGIQEQRSQLHEGYIETVAPRRFNAGGKKHKESAEEQKQQIKESFDLFDTDVSGEIDSK